MPFTHLEKCDMMECYIVCNKNSLQARERYGVLFPTRNLPDRRYFLLLYRKFRSNENVFKKTRTKKQFIISEATEINVLAFFEANPNNAINDLKEESGLSLGTIHNILKKHNDIVELASTSLKRKHNETPSKIAKVYDIGRHESVDDEPINRKTLKTSEIPEVEEALFIWFKQQRNRNAPISGDILKQKAQFFYHEITKKTDFRASHGWFQNLKKRHGIRYMQMSGEKVSANESEIQEFIGKLDAKIIELGLDPEQIYNATKPDAILNSAFAWEQVKSTTLIKSWKNIWPNNPHLATCNPASNNSESILEAALEICNEVELAPASIEEFRTWIVEDNLATDVTDAEIIQEVTTEDDEVIQEAVLEKNFTISCNEALSATRTLLRWCEEKELDFSNISMLKGIQEQIMTDCLHKNKQKKITEFFNV
ncbi:hypothetical protein MML48_4g00003543 [Holotrichia oblita]|uniref:Uncharacterized protein n=1 Tax=Holotrichia oblita TaxID=644536 RepID=A0ACB9TAK7_HOLOL|nr:hypothetical protein MML48_4g00003543 [Holotrichia oblita]